MHIGMPVIIKMHLRIVVAHRLVQNSLRREIERIIAQVGILENIMSGIHTEPVYSAVQPEADDSEHGSFDRRVSPVEVWLLFEKRVQVILTGRVVPFPGRSAHHTQPVVRRGTAGPWVGPYIPIPFGIMARTP